MKHGGFDDVRKHVSSAGHIQKGKALASTSKILNFIGRSAGQTEDLTVIRAETHFTAFLVEHNIALAASDHASDLFRRMFPDSNIAKKYSCGRTKATAVVK